MGATADDVPATERVSKHAANLESLDARGILTALGNCDKELYASESSCGQPGISHRKILNDVGELADVVSELLRRSLTDAKATAATAEPPGTVDANDSAENGKIRTDTDPMATDDKFAEYDFERFASGHEAAPGSAEDEGEGRKTEGAEGADPGADPSADPDAADPGADVVDETPPPAPEVQPTAAVFIVGCGAAARVAFFAATNANHVARLRGFQPIFHALCAGGHRTLFDPGTEPSEDDQYAAVRDFDAALQKAGGDAIVDAMVIGIGGGFRERYVASVLERAMEDRKRRFTIAVLGFTERKHASDAGPGRVARESCEGGANGEPGGPPPGTPHGAPPTFRDAIWRMEPDLGGLLTEHAWNIAPYEPGYGPIDAAEGKWEKRMPMRVRRRKIVNPVLGAECVHGCDALKCSSASKMLLDALLTTGIMMAEDDEREREWEKDLADPSRPDPDADPTNLGPVPGPYPILWEASECALEMVAMYLHSASNVTQQFYQSALGTAKKKKGAKKGKGKDKETGTGKTENENEKDENEEGTISSDAGEQAPKKQFEDSIVHVMERAARTIQSGGSVHFLGHGGVGAVGLVSPPDAVSTFGAEPLDVSAHLGTPGGWSALDIPFVSSPPDGTRDISREHFVDEVLPSLGSKDLVVILASGGCAQTLVMTDDLTQKDMVGTYGSAMFATLRWPEVALANKASGVQVAAVVAPGHDCASMTPSLPKKSALRVVWCARLAELHVKHAVDAIVLGAYVIAGKTCDGGRPVDSVVGNERLFDRAVETVSVVGKCDAEKAKMSLVRSILGDAFDADGGERVPRAEILSKAAVGMRWVVPAAVLLARGARGSVAEAREAAAAGGEDGCVGGVRGVLFRSW